MSKIIQKFKLVQRMLHQLYFLKPVYYLLNHEHAGELRYSDIYKKNGYWCKDVSCKGCGAFPGTNTYDD